MDLTPHFDGLRIITRTDPDPRVRHRADAWLLVAGGLSHIRAAQLAGCAPNSLRNWGRRCLADGRDG
jgi:hypothetical protein